MTFIGVRVAGPTAEIVTDSVAYTYRGTKFHQVTKAQTLPHLDAALVSYGDGAFKVAASEAATVMSERLTSFDELIDSAPYWVSEAALTADHRRPELDPVTTYGCVILVGRSEREEAYVAYRCSNEDPRPQRLHEPFVHPSPLSTRPHASELAWIEATDYGDPQLQEVVRGMVRTWAKNPTPRVDGTAEKWIEIANLAREERSLNGPFLRCWIAGSLYLTRMEHGSIRTTRVHTFNDAGDELRQLVSGSRHPIAQIYECDWCDSGKPFIDCCLAPQLDDDCECLSGETFRECCVVTDRETVPDRLWSPSLLQSS